MTSFSFNQSFNNHLQCFEHYAKCSVAPKGAWYKLWAGIITWFITETKKVWRKGRKWEGNKKKCIFR